MVRQSRRNVGTNRIRHRDRTLAGAVFATQKTRGIDMIANLKLIGDDGHVELLVVPETDTEAIALKVWSDGYWRKGREDGMVEVAMSSLSVSVLSPRVGKQIVSY